MKPPSATSKMVFHWIYFFKLQMTMQGKYKAITGFLVHSLCIIYQTQGHCFFLCSSQLKPCMHLFGSKSAPWAVHGLCKYIVAWQLCSCLPLIILIHSTWNQLYKCDFLTLSTFQFTFLALT